MKTSHPGSSPDKSPSLYSYSNRFTNTNKCRSRRRNNPDYDIKNQKIQPLSAMMNPLFIFMKVFSLYPSYGRNNWPNSVYYGLLFYSTVTVTVNWFNVGRYFWAYTGDVFGPSLFLKIVTHVLYFQIALGTTVFFVTSCKIQKLVALWETIRLDHDPDGVLSGTVRLTVRVTLCLLAVFLFTPFLVFIDHDSNMFMFKILALPFQFNMTSLPVKIGIQVGSAITMFLYMGQWTGATAFLVVMCLRIADDFKKLKCDMKSDIDSCSPRQLMIQFDLELYRQRHLQLCELVDGLDDVISVYVLGAFITNIPVVCFSIYILMSQPFMMYQGSINVLIITISMFIFLMIITVSGTILSDRARSPKGLLYNLDLTYSPVSVETATKLNLFLMKLTEGHLGITGWKLFYIDKQTSKMVVLMIVSYVVILLRFGNHEGVASPGQSYNSTT